MSHKSKISKKQRKIYLKKNTSKKNISKKNTSKKRIYNCSKNGVTDEVIRIRKLLYDIKIKNDKIKKSNDQ